MAAGYAVFLAADRAKLLLSRLFPDHVRRLADRGAMGLGCVRMPKVDMRLSGSFALLPSGPQHLPRSGNLLIVHLVHF
jgi:hypothetical protein